METHNDEQKKEELNTGNAPLLGEFKCEANEPFISERTNANFVSKKFFVYLDGFFKTGWKSGIAETDITLPQSKAESTQLSTQLEKIWEEESKQQSPSLFKACLKAFGPEIIKKATGTYIAESARMVQPFLLYWMLSAFQRNDMIMTYVWAAAFGKRVNVYIRKPLDCTRLYVTVRL